MNKVFKKFLTIIMFVFCCLSVSSCVYVEGRTSIGVRIGTDPTGNFNETIMSIPVGEKSMVAITTYLQTNKQAPRDVRFVVTFEDNAQILDYLPNSKYTTGCDEESIDVGDDGKKIEYSAEASKNSAQRAIKITFIFLATEAGTTDLTVEVYYKNELIKSASARTTLEFE